jgi:Lipase (class 3)
METVRRLGNNPFSGKFYIGDLYTFGSPRVGLNDWASAARTAVSAQTQGHAWRTVNAGDPVTMVPPVLPWDANFIHLDAGWQISPKQAPTVIPSEIGTHTSTPSSFDTGPHRAFFLFLDTPSDLTKGLGDRHGPVLCGSEECDRAADRCPAP